MMFKTLMLAKRVLILPKLNKYIPANNNTRDITLDVTKYAFIYIHKNHNIPRLLLCDADYLLPLTATR